MNRWSWWLVLGSAVGCGGGGGVVEADFTCVGTPVAPEMGDAVPFTYDVLNPSDGVPFPNAEVQLFTDGVPTTDCGGTCEVLRADADARVDVSAPAGWIAYRVVGEPEGAEVSDVGTPQHVTTVEVHAVHPPANGDSTWLNALLAESMEKVFTFAKGKPDHALGKAVVRAVDCGGAAAANLRPVVFGPDGAEMEPVVAYLNRASTFPGVGRSGTNVDGRALLANLPDGDVRIELWGQLAPGAEDERVACEVLPITAGEVTTAMVGPLRADAPESCL